MSCIFKRKAKKKLRVNQALLQTRGRRGGFGLFHFQLDHAYSRFMAAVETGNSSLVREILEGSHLLLEDIGHGSAALVCACKHGDVETILVLLDCGVPPDHFDSGNLAPIHEAARNDHVGTIILLLDHGAKVNLQTKYEKRTALHLAASSGKDQVVRLLLEKRAHVDKQDLYGATPLVLAAGNGWQSTTQVLLDHGALVDAYDHSGWSSLLLAADAGHYETADILLQNHAHVNCQNKFGRTPLHCACARDHLRVVSLLLENKADANIKDLHDKKSLEYTDNILICELLKPYVKAQGNGRVPHSIGELLQLQSLFM